MRNTLILPRRTFLKGLGTVMALPMLESLTALGAPVAATTATGLAGAAPRRAAFIYVPNGADMANWTPSAVGTDFALPATLEPLAEVRQDLLVMSGLACDKARANGDGAGDHARASAAFLTATQPRKTAGADIRVGTSVDQAIAQKVGDLTKFRSLELGCDRGQFSGNCDSGYSCAYSFNVSWRTPTAPMPPETNPRLAFERLFSSEDLGLTAEARARRATYRKSVLDFVMEDAKQLSGKLGKTDQRKLDEYLTSVRDLERRIEHSEQDSAELPRDQFQEGIPADYQAHIRLMYDLQVLAFQTDTTRVATFIVAHDGSNRPYPFIGVSDGHHDLSHHGNDKEKKEKIAKINRFHIEQFAYFVKRLKETKEGTGSLLDNCMVMYGSGIADGNAHAHHDLPILLAGRGGGSITPGRHVKYAKDTPLANLFLDVMDRMGVHQERFGDSTGRLTQLMA
jgi:hypothetical protein